MVQLPSEDQLDLAASLSICSQIHFFSIQPHESTDLTPKQICKSLGKKQRLGKYGFNPRKYGNNPRTSMDMTPDIQSMEETPQKYGFNPKAVFN